MKKSKLWSGIIVGFIFLLNPFATLWAQSHIQNITLQREGDYTNLTIQADAPFQFNHFTEEKKEEKPYRVVIDCLNAINSLPRQNFLKLPQGVISSIRTSQFQTTPDKVCRIVLDLKDPVVYKVAKGAEDKVAIISLSTPQEPVYPLWSAAQGKSAQGRPESPEVSETQKAEKVDQPEPVSEIKDTPIKTAVASEKPLEQPKPENVQLAQKDVKPGQKPEGKPGEKVKPQETSSPQVKKESKPSAPPAEKSKTPEPEKVKAEKADTLKVEQVDTLKKEAAPPGKMPGKVIEETPKREMLVYHSGKRKDPFSTLTDKKNFELGSLPLPNIEELKLVGILEDNSGFKALLENELGYGYILQVGDRIRNGSVVSVEKERVIFQIQEYGYTKNIALELFKPNQEER